MSRLRNCPRTFMMEGVKAGYMDTDFLSTGTKAKIFFGAS